MEYTSGASWGHASRRMLHGLRPRRGPRSRWAVLVPVVTLIAGLLFTTTATTARGTDLRNDRSPELANLIEQRRAAVDRADRRTAALRAEIDGQTNALSGTHASVAEQQRRVAAERAGAGLTALRGPGLTVRLNDAPRRSDGTLPAGAQVDDLVVHQQDVQAVVNALWAGGAEAMSIMGVRVISTSAVRCVGNTLLLSGRVYSPPFRISAIGNPATLRAALDRAGGVTLFREAADAWGLGYDVATERDVRVPAYDDTTTLQYAHVTG
jgi:uncharacterized protein YlxW (UPF0749 family)